MLVRTLDAACRPWLRQLALLAFCVVGLGCGSRRTLERFTDGAPTGGHDLPLSRLLVANRPPLTLLARSGDPRPALAFVASHARGSFASAAVAGLLAGRLEAAGIVGVETRAHGLGIELSLLVESASDVERFIVGVREALTPEVRAGEAALTRAGHEVQALRALSFAGPAESAAAACSGELGVLPGTRLDLSSSAGLSDLEATRRAVFRSDAAAFASIGSDAVLRDAADALGKSRPWPSEPAEADVWPRADITGVDPESESRQLSVALWVPDADAAVGAGAALGSPESELMARLRHLTPAWRLTRSSAISRRVGGCLRLDIAPPRGDPGPSSAEVAQVAALVELSAQTALSHAERGALDESVLHPSDPRRAAALAAWRALSSGRDAREMRRTVAYAAPASDTVSTSELSRALNDARTRLARPSLEVNERIEAGQGEIWMLLASPCGTAVEATADAGAFALVLRAVSRAARGGVRLEPWVTPDGVGLLAHGPRRAPGEQPEAQARRIAAALGRALTQRLEGAELGAARTQLLAELGGQPFEGFALALDGLAPEHPSWLEPRGLWQSVSELPSEALERSRRLLISSPLRLSVLANATGTQARSAALEVSSWLLPFRADPRGCPSVRPEPPRRGQVLLEAANEPALEGAYVGVTLGAPGPAAARIAELSAYVLNRPDGALHRALTAPGVGGTARAHALGGTRRPALLVDVRALPERLPQAVARVREALDHLARGSLTTAELQWAETELLRRDAQARFDPRRRIVELWRAERAPKLELSALRRAQAAFVSGAHWVVSVTPTR